MTTDYTTFQDQTFRDAWKDQASGSNAKDFGRDWPTRNTFNEKLDYVKKYYTSAAAANKDLALKLGTEWLQSNLPKGLPKADGTPYEVADYQDIILPNDKVQDTATTALNKAMFSAAKDIVNGTNTTKQSSQLVDLMAGDLIGAGEKSSYNPDAFIKSFNTVVAPTLVTPSGSLADIKKQYGSLYDKSGKPLFSDTELKNVYNGSPDALQSFRSKLNTAVEDAVKATDPSFAKAGSNQGSVYVAARNKLLSDPAGTLAQNYNANVSGLKTSDKGGWVTSSGTVVGGPASTDTVVGGPVTTGNGVTSLLPKGSFKDANGNFAYTGGEIEPNKMTEFTQSYNPNKGVYRAPSLDASGKLVANSTSPYSNILNGMLSGYKNPFAADYTNQLTMPETPDLTNIKKPFENNPTSKDLLKLANTAGQPYDPKAITSLSPALSKIYQPSITNSAGKATKPGAPDTTNTTLPVVPKAGESIVTGTSAGQVDNSPVKTAAEVAAEKFAADKAAAMNSISSGEYITPATRNFLTSSGKTLTDPKLAAQVDWSAKFEQTPEYKTAYGMTPAEIEKHNADKAAAEKAAAEKVEAERQAGIKVLADKAAADAAEKAAVVTTPGKLTFQSVDGSVVSAEERAKNLELARIAQEAVAKRQAEEKAAAVKAAGGTTDDLYMGKYATKDDAMKAGWSGDGSQWIDPSPEAVATRAAKAAELDNYFTDLHAGEVWDDNQGWIPAPSAQTVALPSSGPQPINPSNGGPTSAITVNPSNAGIVGVIDPAMLSVANLNSNAGGLPTLMGPFQNTVVSSPSGVNALSAQTVALPSSGPSSLAPSNNITSGPQQVTLNPNTVQSQTPAQIAATQQAIQAAEAASVATSAAAPQGGINSLGQQVINPGSTQVLDSSGVPIAGRRRMTMSPVI